MSGHVLAECKKKKTFPKSLQNLSNCEDSEIRANYGLEVTSLFEMFL